MRIVFGRTPRKVREEQLKRYPPRLFEYKLLYIQLPYFFGTVFGVMLFALCFHMFSPFAPAEVHRQDSIIAEVYAKDTDNLRAIRLHLEDDPGKYIIHMRNAPNVDYSDLFSALEGSIGCEVSVRYVNGFFEKRVLDVKTAQGQTYVDFERALQYEAARSRFFSWLYLGLMALSAFLFILFLDVIHIRRD